LLRVRTIWSLGTGQPYVSSHYFVGTDDQAAADAAVADVAAFWGTIDAQVSNNYRWDTDAEVRVMTAQGVVIGSFPTVSQGAVGAETTEELPPATQGLLRMHTGVFSNGRELRGRLFIPGVCEAQNNFGAPTVSYAGLVLGAANTLIGNGTWVVWSRKNIQTELVTSASVWTAFASLRSRRD
jgi:hypothetical protein